MVDLKGKTMIPGLVDAHSHFVNTGAQYTQGFDLSPPPIGNVTKISDIIANLQAYITNNNISSNATIYGAGYDHLRLAEYRHPTKYELDSVSTTNPIVLRHNSGHMLVANSLAIQSVGITDANQTNIAAGIIIDKFVNGTNTGLFKEVAQLPFLNQYLTIMLRMSQAKILSTVNLYAASGITTASDLELNLYDAMGFQAQGSAFPIDVNAHYWFSSNATSLITDYNNAKSKDTARVKLRGAKFLTDGSIQGYTGWLSQPYWVPQSLFSSNLTNYTYDSSRTCAN